MRWSSPIHKDEENLNATVLDYKPRDFSLGTPDAALDYLERKKAGADFVLSDVLRKTTGVENIEKESEEQLIEQKVLERISVIQKQAFDEGFKLGQDEGYRAAQQKKEHEIDRGLQDLSQLMISINNLKPEMAQQNEAHLINLVYQIAERIAYSHIEQNPQVVVEVIRRSIESAQADEEVTVIVNPEQVQFLENYRTSEKRELDFLKNTKIQGSENVQIGSCIIETNYGVIDARLDERVKKLWSEISAALPKVTQTVE